MKERKKVLVLLSALLLVLLQTTSLALVNQGYQNPIVNVVNYVKDSVVRIDVTTRTKVYIDPYFEEFFKRYFGYSPDQYRESQGIGSGFVVDSRGYIVTNQHVVKNATKIKVTFINGSEYEAQYIAGDDELDIAVIKITPKETLKPLEFADSSKLQIGEWAIAIGNPLGFQHTVTLGIVSAFNRTLPQPEGNSYYVGLIQTDAAINPGNSGGPLLNIYGQVIGINTAIINPSQAMNIGFAISSNIAKKFVGQIIKTGKITKGYLGVYIQEVTEDFISSKNLKNVSYGAYISQVEKNSPADNAGLKAGDVVIKVGDIVIESAGVLTAAIRTHTAGEKVNLQIVRNGKVMNLTVTLGELKQ